MPILPSSKCSSNMLISIPFHCYHLILFMALFELILLRVIVAGISAFLPLWLLQNDYNLKVGPQNIRANSLIVWMGNPRPREVQLLDHGHTASKSPEVHRISIWRDFKGYGGQLPTCGRCSLRIIPVHCFFLYILLTSFFIGIYDPKNKCEFFEVGRTTSNNWFGVIRESTFG